MAEESRESPRGMRRLWLPVSFAAALGVLGGLGGYTLRYAEGLSYLSRDPEACVNCHIMQPQFDAWQKASHHAVAVCVDCHLPESFFYKYYTKAENGYRHGKLFTTQTFREPIEIGKAGRKILQENCIRCHGELTHNITMMSHDESTPCVKCHATAGHGQRLGLGGPLRSAELNSGK
jgi:cytochrome c nitrite reductase small subunit